MSDLAATNCGCGCDDNCGGGLAGRGFFGGDCSCVILVLLLLSCCGNGFGGEGCGCGDNSCFLILILLLCCGGNGRGFC